MTQSVYCKNCQTKTDVTKEVMDRIDQGATKIKLRVLNVDCCNSPNLYWVASKNIIGGRKKEITQEKIAGKVKSTEESEGEENVTDG